MRLINKFENYLCDREYKIIVKDNYIDIINYNEIVDFSLNTISIKVQNKLITIEGKNLAISKMIENEVLIIGSISNIHIN